MDHTQGLLQLFPFPDDTRSGVVNEYDMTSQIYTELRDRFGMTAIAGTGSDFSRANRVMNYLYGVLLHDPYYLNSSHDTSVSLLERLLHQQPINCRGAAHLMCGCLLAVGIPCKAVWLLSADPYDTDCHVVPVAYCKEFGKWIMFDPTVNAVCYNSDGQPLSILEVRDRLASKQAVEYSRTVRFMRTNCSYDYQRRMFTGYLSKNLFMMKSTQVHSGMDSSVEGKTLYLIPKGVDIGRFCAIQSGYYNKVIHTLHNAVFIGKSELFENNPLDRSAWRKDYAATHQ